MGVLVGLIAVLTVAMAAGLGGKVREILGGGANAIQLGMNGQLAAAQSGGGLSLSGGIVSSPEPPILSTPPGTVASVRPGQSLGTVVVLSAMDPQGWSLVWSASGLPSWLSLSSSGQLSIVSVPPSTSSTISFPFTAQVANAAKSASGSFSVSLVNSPPVATAASGQLATVRPGQAGGQIASIGWTDADLDPVGISTSGLPAWLSLDASSGVLSIVSSPPPVSSDTPFAFTATASDGKGGTVSQSYSVLLVNSPPSISTPPGQLASLYSGAGPQAIATFSATDPNSDPIAWSASGLPSWLSLSSSGALSIPSGQTAPSPASATSYPFTVSASDGKGGTASASYSVSVSTPSCASFLATWPNWGTQTYLAGTPGTPYNSNINCFYAVSGASGGNCPGFGPLGGLEFCTVNYIGGAWRYACGCNGSTFLGTYPSASSPILPIDFSQHN